MPGAAAGRVESDSLLGEMAGPGNFPKRGTIGKKVARAAATGGSRAKAGEVPVVWYSSLVAIVILGLVTVVYSRYEYLHPAVPVQPAVGTHWTAAYAFDICGTLEKPLPAPKDEATSGITTTGNGVIQIAPKNQTEAGTNATLGRFVTEYPGLSVSPGQLQLPGKANHVNGQRCGTKPAYVEIQAWPSLLASSPSVTTSNPFALRLENGQLITIGFVPKGTKLPKPPSAANLFSSATTTTTTPVTVPKSTTTTKPSSSKSTATTKPSSSKSTATTKPSSSKSAPAKNSSSKTTSSTSTTVAGG